MDDHDEDLRHASSRLSKRIEKLAQRFRDLEGLGSLLTDDEVKGLDRLARAALAVSMEARTVADAASVAAISRKGKAPTHPAARGVN